MPISTQQRLNIRLKNEYDELMKVKNNPVYTIEIASGQTTPYVRKYLVTFHVPTYINSGRSIQVETRVEVLLPDTFPDDAPKMIVSGSEVPYHVNWWASGSLCNGNFWNPNRWLWEYFNFAAEVLINKPSRVNVKSPANREAIPFFEKNKNHMPLKQVTLPDPNKPKPKIKISF